MIDKIKIDSLDLRPKLILAFVLVAALVAITGAIGYTSVTTVDEEAHIIAEDGQKMDAAAEMVVAIEMQQGAIQASQLSETLHDQVSMFNIRGDGVVGGGSATDAASQRSAQANGGVSPMPEDARHSFSGGEY